jgi:hypothetical protein
MAYRSILTVVTPAADYSLVDLPMVKDEFGIIDATTDPRLTRWIRDAGYAIHNYLGGRVLRAELVSEAFRSGGYPANYPRDGHGEYFYPRNSWGDSPGVGCLRLSRFPVVSITSILEDGGPPLDPMADFEVDAKLGEIYRLSGTDRIPWSAQIVVVLYTGGYVALTDVPGDIQEACLLVLKHRRAAQTRDPMLRQVSVPGVLEQQFWVGTPSGSASGLPPEAEQKLFPYCDVHI